MSAGAIAMSGRYSRFAVSSSPHTALSTSLSAPLITAMLVHGGSFVAQWPYHSLPTLECWQVKLGRAAAAHSKICSCCRGGVFAPSSHARLDNRHQARHLSSSPGASAVDDQVAVPTVTLPQPVTGLDTCSDSKSQHFRNAKPQMPKAAPSTPKTKVAKQRRQKPLLPKLILSSQSSYTSGTIAIKQIIARLQSSLQELDATSCHRALQELEAAAGKVSEEDLLAASSSTAHQYLFQQATKNDQPKSIPVSSAAESSSSALTPQDKPTVSYITHSVHQQPVPDPQQLHTMLISHLEGYDVLQRADLLWRAYRSSVLELFLAKRHEDWAQDFVFKQQPKLPENVYITLITLCSEHNSLKTLNAVLEVHCLL